MSLGTVLKTYNQLAGLPFGKKIFSILFSLKAPYFSNIRATVNDLKPGTGEFIVITCFNNQVCDAVHA